MRLILDIEADALEVEKVQSIWCICVKDIDTSETYFIDDPNVLRQADLIIGHNIIGYDYPVLDRFYPGVISKDVIGDTLVLSRLLKYQLDDGEGHSLEAWGQRFGSPKWPTPGFTQTSPELLEYCKQDVHVTWQLYLYLKEWMSDVRWGPAIAIEHDMAWVCMQMQKDGFSFDIKAAEALREDLLGRLGKLDENIRTTFLPKLRPVRDILPRLTKQGTISKSNMPRDWTDYTLVHPDCPFTYCISEPFNPGSPSQVVERLNESGWKPTVPTKSGKSWKICEENLATLPESAPEAARLLVERLLIASRVRTLDEWKQAYDPRDKRIHARFNAIGTWTGRMSHVRPNLGNIAAPKSIKYKGETLSRLATSIGGSMRRLWHSSDDWWLVGTDAEGIQLRILAHYIDEKVFTEALVNGDKSRGTDPHTINGRILGCDRDTAKTFIYAFLLGGGDSKLGEILGVGSTIGRRRKREFIDAYLGLRILKERTIPEFARAGGFEGLDGRFVRCNDEHLMLAAMLQNGEAVIMKHANILWRKKLEEANITFRQVNMVHDEWQTEVRGSRTTAEDVGRLQASSIEDTGRFLSVRCPLAGSSRVGKNWLETH